MKNVAIGLLIFAGGVGTGVLATRGYFKRKYSQAAAAEVGEIREYYKNKVRELN